MLSGLPPSCSSVRKIFCRSRPPPLNQSRCCLVIRDNMPGTPPPVPPPRPSSRFPLQVLPTFAPRLAVTLWFYGRDLGLPRVPPAVPTRRSPSEPAAVQEQPRPGDDTRDKVRPLPTPGGSGAAHASEVCLYIR